MQVKISEKHFLCYTCANTSIKTFQRRSRTYANSLLIIFVSVFFSLCCRQGDRYRKKITTTHGTSLRSEIRFCFSCLSSSLKQSGWRRKVRKPAFEQVQIIFMMLDVCSKKFFTQKKFARQLLERFFKDLNRIANYRLTIFCCFPARDGSRLNIQSKSSFAYRICR